MGLRGGGSQLPPTAALVGSWGAGAAGGRWISTLGWGPSPVGFAQLPVSHGLRAGEAAGARGSGGAVGAPGVRGHGRRQPTARLQRAASGSAPGLRCRPAAGSAPPSCCQPARGCSPPTPACVLCPPRQPGGSPPGQSLGARAELRAIISQPGRGAGEPRWPRVCCVPPWLGHGLGDPTRVPLRTLSVLEGRGWGAGGADAGRFLRFWD